MSHEARQLAYYGGRHQFDYDKLTLKGGAWFENIRQLPPVAGQAPVAPAQPPRFGRPGGRPDTTQPVKPKPIQNGPIKRPIIGQPLPPNKVQPGGPGGRLLPLPRDRGDLLKGRVAFAGAGKAHERIEEEFKKVIDLSSPPPKRRGRLPKSPWLDKAHSNVPLSNLEKKMKKVSYGDGHQDF